MDNCWIALKKTGTKYNDVRILGIFANDRQAALAVAEFIRTENNIDEYSREIYTIQKEVRSYTGYFDNKGNHFIIRYVPCNKILEHIY